MLGMLRRIFGEAPFIDIVWQNYTCFIADFLTVELKFIVLLRLILG